MSHSVRGARSSAEPPGRSWSAASLRRRRARHGADDDHTLPPTPRRRSDRPNPPLREAGRHHPRSCPDIESTLRSSRSSRAASRSSPTFISIISARWKRPTPARACLLINPATSARPIARPRKSSVRPSQWRFDPHRVNAGILEKHLLEKYRTCGCTVESALDHIRILARHDFREYRWR